jgi:hypothetical protein
MRLSLTLACISTIIISLVLTGGTNARVNMDNAIGIWLLDEGAGDLAKDSSGKGNDGEIIGAEWVDDGKFGTALRFDGAGSHVNCGHDESFNVTDEITIVAWARIESDSNWQDIIAKDIAGGTNSWQMFARHSATSGKPRGIIIVDDGGNWKAVSPDADADTADGDWHHYALTYNISDGVARYYIDGVESGTAEDPGKNQIQVTETDVYMGKKTNDTAPFGGVIDEVAVFNVALSGDDIRTIMEQGISRASAVESANKLSTTWAGIKTQ